MHKNTFNLRSLRLSLKFRPEIMRLVLKMRHRLWKKSQLLNILKQQLKKRVTSEKTSTFTQTDHNTEDLGEKKKHLVKQQENTENIKDTKFQSAFTQTDENTESNSAVATTMAIESNSETNENEIPKLDCSEETNVASNNVGGWNLNSGENEMSIADQVKEAAQSAMQERGMVYVESAGMYYDYKTGYYYSSELGLYYHPDTKCYYNYSEDKNVFEFHSYPDTSQTATNTLYEAHEKKKDRRRKKARKCEERDIDNLTKCLAQEKEEDNEHGSKPKRKKKLKKKINENKDNENKELKSDSDEKENASVDVKPIGNNEEDKNAKVTQELEDGECSESGSEKPERIEDVESDESDDSMSTVSDNDDSIARHHPPSMRVIVRETNLSKLKVGSLFLVTKDGGTVGREGSCHTILIEDSNISRNHLDIQYNTIRKVYTVTDLGSKNGTTLNGVRISDSKIVSEPVEVMHGSILQLGETKLLCHIHPGIDTCGHCEPGLVMEMQEKEKKAAYTRTCSVQKQHQLELARLKNKYAPKPLAIEETAYNDRAKERRDKVGSSHHSEKTQRSDLDTFIAPENKGFRLLEKMGWSKGEGLGKDNQGDIEPVPLVSNDGKSGLGTKEGAAAPSLVPKSNPKNTLGSSTMRLAAKTKMLQPPAKAFQDPLDEDSE